MSRKIHSLYDRPKSKKLSFSKPSMTKQSFRDESNLNNIMKRFEKTGQLPNLISQDPSFGDFSDPISYQDSLNLVIKAGEQFAALPSRVRDRFGNDPQQFLMFVNDASNVDEMIRMGIAKKTDSQPDLTPKSKPSPAKPEPEAKAT